MMLNRSLKILVVSFFLFLQPLLGSYKERLQHLSLQDKTYLRHFFRKIIYQDVGGHVLCFENKPVCSSGAVLKMQGASPQFKERLVTKGWLTWKRVESLFPHENFIFCEEPITVDRPNLKYKYLQILIVNVKATRDCLQKHEHVFKEVLGSHFSVEDFLDDVREKRELLSLINSDQALLGILLGFGEESSLIFKEKTRDRLPAWTDDYQGVGMGWAGRPSMIPVAFIGNPQSEEVRLLVDAYDREYHELKKMYWRKDLLKVTLHHLCQR